jgi:hypothetical protein
MYTSKTEMMLSDLDKSAEKYAVRSLRAASCLPSL